MSVATGKYQSGYEAVAESLADKEMRRQYRDVLDTIDVSVILDHYDAAHVTPMGNEILHSCLIDRVDPHHANGDQNPSATLNVEKRLYLCRVYGGGDIFWFLDLMEGGNFARMREVLSGALSPEVNRDEHYLDTIKGLLNGVSVHSPVIPTYHPRVIERWERNDHPYMSTVRGIDPEVLRAYRVGYDPDGVRIILPHFWRGKLVGWQARAQDDKRWELTPYDPEGHRPKYKNTHGFPRNETVYNLDTVEKRLAEGLVDQYVVVESVLSVLKAETFFRQTADPKWAGFVCTFGAKANTEQLRLLRAGPRIVYWPDNDYAGLSAAQKAIEYLNDYRQVDLVLPDDDRDLADLDESQGSAMLADKVPMPFALMDLRQRLLPLEKNRRPNRGESL